MEYLNVLLGLKGFHIGSGNPFLRLHHQHQWGWKQWQRPPAPSQHCRTMGHIPSCLRYDSAVVSTGRAWQILKGKCKSVSNWQAWLRDFWAPIPFRKPGFCLCKEPGREIWKHHLVFFTSANNNGILDGTFPNKARAPQVAGRGEFWLSWKDEKPKSSSSEGSMPLFGLVAIEREESWDGKCGWALVSKALRPLSFAVR